MNTDSITLNDLRDSIQFDKLRFVKHLTKNFREEYANKILSEGQILHILLICGFRYETLCKKSSLPRTFLEKYQEYVYKQARKQVINV